MGILGSILNGVAEAIKDSGSDWTCDNCGAYLNSQPGFTTENGVWECTECGEENDVSEDNIVADDFVGVLREFDHDDGTKETVRFTKTREVHDFRDFDGTKKGSIWRKR